MKKSWNIWNIQNIVPCGNLICSLIAACALPWAKMFQIRKKNGTHLGTPHTHYKTLAGENFRSLLGPPPPPEVMQWRDNCEI